MSTVAQVTNNTNTTTGEWWQTEKSVHTSENLSNESYTLVVGYTKAEADKENAKQGDGKVSAKPEGEDTEQAIAKGEFVELYRQTFRQYFPDKIAGVSELVPDDEEVLNLVYASLKVKQSNRARSLVVSKGFSPQNFVIDLFDEAGRKSERRLTQMEKIEKDVFENLSPEQRNTILQKLLAMQQGA